MCAFDRSGGLGFPARSRLFSHHEPSDDEASVDLDLRKDDVAVLVKTHVLTLKEVIDFQASGDAARAYVALRHAADHMAMIANPLVDAIVKQFPAKYTS
jgi:hypothetical protein